jgi:putative ABC transport system ATP-binding protein
MTLVLDEVVKHYRSRAGEVVRAVDGVTLCLEPGEMLALYGPSGSGKTTLLELAGTLLKPDRGRVLFGGRDVGALDDARAADYRLREVGVIDQDYELMRGVPAVENAAVKLFADGMPMKEARERAMAWLARVGLEHRASASPEELSGGERQRVAIARALANDPALILADEPTGNLDTQRGREVLELLRSIAHERRAAVLLVTHDPEAAEIADRVETLRDGRLADDGEASAPAAETEPSQTGA